MEQLVYATKVYLIKQYSHLYEDSFNICVVKTEEEAKNIKAQYEKENEEFMKFAEKCSDNCEDCYNNCDQCSIGKSLKEREKFVYNNIELTTFEEFGSHVVYYNSKFIS